MPVESFPMLSRRSIMMGLVGLAGLASLRARLIQVSSFTIAAALGRILRQYPTENFTEPALQWKTLQPIAGMRASGSRGMITYHPWYHRFQASAANQCLAKAVELGAGYIRIDLRWMDLFPDGETVNEAAWAWYDSYLRAATDWYGLTPLIVLFNPPKAALRLPLEARMTAWAEYVTLIAQRLGKRCSYYQILNEPNNRVFRVFPWSAVPAALASAAQIIHRHNPAAKTTINILADLPGWLTDLERVLQDSMSAIDIVGIDFYPGTWTISPRSIRSNWDRLTTALKLRRESTASPLYRQPIAILETGYSTNVSLFRNEDSQVKYFRTLGEAVAEFDAQIRPDQLEFVGIHELTDGESDAVYDPEAHFGLIYSDLRRQKPAFQETRNLFIQLQT